MSKLIPLAQVVFLLLCHASTRGQSSYQPKVGHGSYSPLGSEATQLNDGPWPEWHSYENIPLGFSFRYFDRDFTSFRLEVSSRMVFDDAHEYYFDPLTMVSLVDAGNGTTKTALLYHTSGTAGERVFTLEYRNVHLGGDTSLYVNFQTIIYESSGVIEFLMGPHNVTSLAGSLSLGPYAGVYHLRSVDPIDFEKGIHLVGDPNHPEVKEFEGKGVPYLKLKLTGLPAEGTLYRYTPIDYSDVAEPNDNRFLFHWNSADHQLFIPDDGVGTLMVYNMAGQLCMQHWLDTPRPIDMGHLPKGLYLCSFKNHHFKLMI